MDVGVLVKVGVNVGVSVGVRVMVGLGVMVSVGKTLAVGTGGVGGVTQEAASKATMAIKPGSVRNLVTIPPSCK